MTAVQSWGWKNPLADVASSVPKAAAVAVAQVGILAVGWSASTAQYTDADFAARQLPTLVAVTAFLGIVTLMMNRPAEIGLRAASDVRLAWMAPGAVLVLAAAGVFAGLWFSLPDGAQVDGSTMLKTAATTLLVGLTEEWTYRGLLLVVLVRAFGFRRGALAAAVGFGLLHAINPIAGQSVGGTVSQVVITTIISSVFLLAVLGSRSLWPAALLHGVYDFFVIGGEQFKDAGAETSVGFLVPIATVGVAMYSIRQLRHAAVGHRYEEISR